MFWTANEEFVKPVKLSWVRISRPFAHTDVASADPTHVDGMEETEEEHFTIESAVWRQRDRAHYLVYENPSETGESEGTTGRTTLRLEENQLTLIRFGDVTWNHSFREGVMSSSILRTAYASLDVEIETKSLRIDVSDDGGRIVCEYALSIGGVPQQVALEIGFTRLDEE